MTINKVRFTTIIFLLILSILSGCAQSRSERIRHYLRAREADPVTLLFLAPDSVTVTSAYDALTKMEYTSKEQAINLREIEEPIAENLTDGLKKLAPLMRIQSFAAASSFMKTESRDLRNVGGRGYALLPEYRFDQPDEKERKRIKKAMKGNDSSPRYWLLPFKRPFEGSEKTAYRVMDFKKLIERFGTPYVLLVAVDGVHVEQKSFQAKVTFSISTTIVSMKKGVVAVKYTQLEDTTESGAITGAMYRMLPQTNLLLENKASMIKAGLMAAGERYAYVIADQLKLTEPGLLSQVRNEWAKADLGAQ